MKKVAETDSTEAVFIEQFKAPADKKVRERLIGNLQRGEASCNIKCTEIKIKM